MIETQICAYPQFSVLHLSSIIELLGFFVKFSDARQFVDPLWSTIQMDPARRIAFFLLPKYKDGYYNSTWCSGKLRYCSSSYSFNSLNSFDGSRLVCEKWSQVVKIVALKSVTESFHAHWDIVLSGISMALTTQCWSCFWWNDQMNQIHWWNEWPTTQLPDPLLRRSIWQWKDVHCQ